MDRKVFDKSPIVPDRPDMDFGQSLITELDGAIRSGSKAARLGC
jgi:hypothetical protein